MTVPAKVSVPEGDVMESVIAKGDLAKLTPDERVRYYTAVCKSLGLNALTQPLSYITLNGKLTLYATRTCTDQLRKINGVSLEIVSRHVDDDILTVHVKAHTPDGRTDEDLGSVAFPATLKGEARANAALKAVTKAKRRATLSICGLGWLDETEVADIPESTKPLTIEEMAREAAMRGQVVFSSFYQDRTAPEKTRINAIGKELRRILDSRASPAGDSPHPVTVDDAREGGVERELPPGSDPAPADHDPTAVDVISDELLKNIEAYKRGQEAKRLGHMRKALPPEYRESDRTREALAWEAGWSGQSMPTFNGET